MTGSTHVVLSTVPDAERFKTGREEQIYARRIGNPFARRHNFYRKVATIRRQSGNEKGGARRKQLAMSRGRVTVRC
jgi:hypothetical protein